MTNSRKKIAIVAAAVGTAGAVGAGIAVAVGTVNAPYAQATAIVRPDGTILRDKGVASLTRTGTGSYCVKLTIGAPANTLMPVASIASGSGEVTVIPAATSCPDSTQSVGVYTRDSAGSLADRWFTLLVP